MTDDPRTPPLDEPELLAASAYVDGLADADERALVESSPHLLAWVEEQRRTQASIAGVPPVSAEVRDRAIAAALAAFDGLEHAPEHDLAAAVLASPAPSPPAAPVISLAGRRARRFSSRALLGAAAAVVAVLAIGGAVLTNTETDDEVTSGGAPAGDTALERITGDAPAALEPFGAEAAETEAASAASAPDPAAAAAPAPASTIGSIDASAEAGGAADSDVPPLASETADAPGDDTADTTAATIAAAALPVAIADQEALAAFANEALAASAAGTAPDVDAGASACAGGDLQVVGRALYGAAGTPVYVVVDTAAGLAEAVTLDCDEVLASTDL